MTIDSSSIPALLTSLLVISLGAIGVLWNRYEKKIDTLQREHKDDLRSKDEAITRVVTEHMADLRKQDATATYQEQRVQELIEKLHEMMMMTRGNE